MKSMPKRSEVKREETWNLKDLFETEAAYERAIEDWCKSGNDRADLKEIAVYVKPEESAIFYVINGKATGRVAF